ncbi:MAG: LysM peptidoglycan-binding domain-containing protein [Armatimonadota bacterium]|nr:LysM peptidoglycan-binding domain-containing protein [Armatimonadota bacterium]
MRLGTVSAAAVLVLALAGPLAPPAPASASAHVVRPGETLYQIALRYGVPVDALAAANGIADPARIRAGQVLRIPAAGARPVRPSAAPRIAPPSVQTSARGPRADLASVQVRRISLRYTVGRGDTLYGIARRFGVTVHALRGANGLRSDLIHPGQRLVVPGARVVVRIPPPGPTVRLRLPVPQPAPAPQIPDLDTGDEISAPRPVRVRRGPASYFTTLAVAAAQTPLQVVGRRDEWYEVRLPDDTTGWIRAADLTPPPPIPASPQPAAAVIVREALQYVGTRYVWGGASAGGLDCSGFVYLVFSAFAPELARLRSFDYFRLGVPVPPGQLRPGDLVFFTTYAPGASHVGIYLGDRRFIHASSSARQVTVSSLDEPYYAARYVGARRLAP